MSFFGDLFAGKAALQAANYNAALSDRDAKLKSKKLKRVMPFIQNLIYQDLMTMQIN